MRKSIQIQLLSILLILGCTLLVSCKKDDQTVPQQKDPNAQENDSTNIPDDPLDSKPRTRLEFFLSKEFLQERGIESFDEKDYEMYYYEDKVKKDVPFYEINVNKKDGTTEIILIHPDELYNREIKVYLRCKDTVDVFDFEIIFQDWKILPLQLKYNGKELTELLEKHKVPDFGIAFRTPFK